MTDQTQGRDFTPVHDETELIELSRGDEHGGTTQTITLPPPTILCPSIRLCTYVC